MDVEGVWCGISSSPTASTYYHHPHEPRRTSVPTMSPTATAVGTSTSTQDHRLPSLARALSGSYVPTIPRMRAASLTEAGDVLNGVAPQQHQHQHQHQHHSQHQHQHQHQHPQVLANTVIASPPRRASYVGHSSSSSTAAPNYPNHGAPNGSVLRRPPYDQGTNARKDRAVSIDAGHAKIRAYSHDVHVNQHSQSHPPPPTVSVNRPSLKQQDLQATDYEPGGATTSTADPHLQQQTASSMRCPSCSNMRGVVQQVVSNLLVLDMEMNDALHGDGVSSERAPEVARDGTTRALQWTLDNVRLQLARLRRWRRDASGGHAHAALARKHSMPAWDAGSAKRKFDDFSADEPNLANQRPRSGSMFEPTSSSRAGIPSPPSTNFSFAEAGASPLTPTSAHHGSADLQQRLHAKSLAVQALQREQESLVQKLERQRAKTVALERKFELAEAETAQLGDEKDRLQANVATLEAQVAQLAKARDDARSQSAADGGQYMKIMDMASRLQAQGAADKKRWTAEKDELEARIADLQKQAQSAAPPPSLQQQEEDQRKSASPSPSPLSKSPPPRNTATDVKPDPDPRETATPTVDSSLEVQRLQSRVHLLEAVLRELAEDSVVTDQAVGLAKHRSAQLLAKMRQVQESLPPCSAAAAKEAPRSERSAALGRLPSERVEVEADADAVSEAGKDGRSVSVSASEDGAKDGREALSRNCSDEKGQDDESRSR